jgi:hypothetical protein
MIGNWFHDPATLALAAIMLILLPVMLSFQEQRPRRAIAEAIVLGSGAMLHKDMLVSLGHGRWEMILTLLNMCAAGSIVLIVVRLLALRVVLFVGPRLVVQTGSLCWTCARDLSGNVSGSCPDCGGRVPHHSEVWDARRRRPGRGWRFVMLCVLGSSAYILLARIAEVPWPRSYFRESYIDLCCLLIFVPSLVLLWLERRRVFPRHRCQKCGYDLTGNVSGVCPECGRVVSAGKTEVTKAIPTASETK